MPRIGYWYSEEEPELPVPDADSLPYSMQMEFLALLSMVETSFMEKYLEAFHLHEQKQRDRRIRIALSNKKEVPVEPVMGPQPVSSNEKPAQCCLCGKMIGRIEFDVEGWQWPQGYLHYLKHHNVRPDSAFAVFIVSQVDKSPILTKRLRDLTGVDGKEQFRWQP